MKLTKIQLKEMVREVVQSHLNESGSETADRRMRQLDQYRTMMSLSSYEILEDILEQLSESTWKTVLEGIKRKYGYRI